MMKKNNNNKLKKKGKMIKYKKVGMTRNFL